MVAIVMLVVGIGGLGLDVVQVGDRHLERFQSITRYSITTNRLGSAWMTVVRTVSVLSSKYSSIQFI